MSSNRQNREQRVRSQNTTNTTREPTVLTLAEDPASSSPYLIPNQDSFSPSVGNMYKQFQQQGQQQQSSVSIPDMNGFQHQQQPNLTRPFNQAQSPTLYSNMQTLPRGQSKPVSSGEGLSDLDKLRQLKSTILAGQHPYFQPVPNPEALAKIYLGPHMASQIYQEQQPKLQQTQQQQQQNPQQSSPAKNEPGALPQSQPETVSIPRTPDLPTQGSPKCPQSSNKSDSPKALGTLPTPQSSGFPLSGEKYQPSTNGDTLPSNDGSPPNPTIPQNTVDTRPTTPSSRQLNSVKSSPALSPQRLQATPSGSIDQQVHGARVETPMASSSLSGLVDPSKATETKETAIADRETDPDLLPHERERDRDRDRPGYPPYDSSRYFQTTDRRHFPRFPPRYHDPRYDRDRSWDRSRDWDRDRDRDRGREQEREKEREREHERERELERDKDRLRVDEKPLDERRIEYPRPSRPIMDRRSLPTQAGGNEEQQKPTTPSEPRAMSIQHSDLRRSELSLRLDSSHQDQPTRHPDVTLSRSVAPRPPSSGGQRRADGFGAFSHSTQTLDDRERFRFGANTPPPGPLHGSTMSQKPSPFQPQPSQPPQPPQQPLRQERLVSGPSSVNDRVGPRSVHAAGNSTSRPGNLPDSNRRPENLTSRVGPPSIDNNTPQAVPERRLTHPEDPSSPRALVPDSRVASDDRDTSRSFYTHPSAPPPIRAVPRPPSSAGRRPDDSSYGDRDRGRDRGAPPPNYRESPQNVPAARGFVDDLRRQPVEASSSRRPSGYYSATPPVAPVADRVAERQWRDRENYPSTSYHQDSDDRARRFASGRWSDGDSYGRERDVRGEIDRRPGRPVPPHAPASWERERMVDKDKVRDRFDGWSAQERKYPSSEIAVPPSSVPLAPPWEEPVPPPHVQRPPLQARLTDTYDERFIPAARTRYPAPPTPSDDVPMRDNFRENPRVRPRSPSPAARSFEDTHRAKRQREGLTRPPYYDDTRRTLPSEYDAGIPPSPQSYYDPRTTAIANPRDPLPYSRDQTSEPYPRRNMPPRSPQFFARERYPPR